MLLVGQGSIPLAIPVLVALILAPSIPGIMDGRPPLLFTWELSLCIVLSYPVLSPILTVILTTPYHAPFKLLLRRIAFKHAHSMPVVKF